MSAEVYVFGAQEPRQTTARLPLADDRVVSITCPLVISTAELRRIQAWLAVQLIIKNETEEEGGDAS